MHWGYFAILLGTFFEGETVLVVGGFAARRGYLTLGWVMLAAFVGAFAGDQLFFWMGRRWGRRAVERRPRWRARLHRVDALLARHGTALLVGFRFLYGLRSITPVALGASHVPAARFVALDAIGCAAWAAVVATIGWAFGAAVERVLGHVERYERLLFVGLAVVGLTVAVIVRARRPHPQGVAGGSSQPPTPATSASASRGPQLPGS